MSNTDNPGHDEEQLTSMLRDYRALLAVTRPLVVAEHTLPSWRGGELCRSGFRNPLQAGDRCAEFTMRRGEIFRSDKLEFGITGDEALPTVIEEVAMGTTPQVEHAAGPLLCPRPQTDSNLQIRIYLGMS